MPRTKAIFTWLFEIEQGDTAPFSIDFVEVSDAGTDPAVIAARAEREEASLRGFVAGVSRSIPPGTAAFLKAVGTWLYTEHTAYACHDEMISTVDVAALPKEVLDSY